MTMKERALNSITSPYFLEVQPQNIPFYTPVKHLVSLQSHLYFLLCVCGVTRKVKWDTNYV